MSTGRPVRAAVLVQPGLMELREFVRPAVGDDEGLLRVELAGVCGTDVKIYDGKLPGVPYPVIPGHEIVGVIEEVGPAAASRWGVRPGDRVVVAARLACGRCAECRSGRARRCPNSLSYGISAPAERPPHLWGALAELLYLPATAAVYRVPADLSPEVALVSLPLANGFEWTGKGGVAEGDVVVIQGVGVQGLSALVAARARSAGTVICVGLSVDQERLGLASELGADLALMADRQPVLPLVREATGGRMADVVMDITGNPKALALSVELARQGATLVLAGLTGDGVRAEIVADEIVRKELRIQGVYSKDPDSIPEALQYAATRGEARLGRMVTHVFPLGQAETAIRMTAGRLGASRPVKAAVAPDAPTP